MPDVRAFRALRYAHAPSSDMSALLCPPYDIIGPELLATLMARDPHNAVRLELPQPDAGGPSESRYAGAARTLATWRAEGTLVTDGEPTVTIHEMTFRDAGGAPRRAVGVFAQVRLEPFGDGIRRHERTLTGPKEDRFALLSATGVNLSPVVLLHAGERARTRSLIEALSAGAPDARATTDDGVGHRAWVVPGTAPAAGELLDVIGRSSLTIADGHHRYETALRHRDQRARAGSVEGDAPWDHVFALLYHEDDAPPVLPTHRVLLRGPAGEGLLAAWQGLFDVERLPDAGAVLARMTAGAPAIVGDATGTGRIGLVSGGVAAILSVRPDAFAMLLAGVGSAASCGLDVNRVAAALERVGVDAAALAVGDRVRYVKRADEAVALAVDGGAAAALLLDGPPVSAVTRVAAAGEVMPQKSTYFDPKAPTGLLFRPAGR